MENRHWQQRRSNNNAPFAKNNHFDQRNMKRGKIEAESEKSRYQVLAEVVKNMGGPQALLTTENESQSLAHDLQKVISAINEGVVDADRFVELAIGFSWKIPYFCRILLILNQEERNHQFIQSCLQKASHSLEFAVGGANFSENFFRAKTSLRLIAALVQAEIVLQSDLVDIYEKILNFGLLESTGVKSETTTTDLDNCLHELVLQSLPWAFSMFDNSDFLARIWVRLEQHHLENAASISKLLLPWRTSVTPCDEKPVNTNNNNNNNNSESSLKHRSVRDELWQILVQHKEKGSDAPPPLLLDLAKLDTISSATQHSFPVINFENPTKLEQESAPTTHPTFSALQPQSYSIVIFPEIPAELSLLHRYMLEEEILSVVYNFTLDYREGATQLELLLRPERLEEMFPEKTNRGVLDQLLVETLFGQLLRLPSPVFLEIYYTDLIAEMFKKKPTVFPGLIKKTMDFLVENLDDLDLELTDRLSTWFAFHLNTFNFKWPWKTWADKLEKPTQRRWVTSALDKLARISYTEKVQQSLEACPEVSALVPPKPEPAYQFRNAQVEGYAEAERLLLKLRAKESAKAIISWIEDDMAFTKLQYPLNVQIVAQCFCFISSKFFSHFYAACERYRELLLWICQRDTSPHETDTDSSTLFSAQNGFHFLASVADFWKHHPQNIGFYFEKFVTAGISTPSEVINWVFSFENKSHEWIWAILRRLLNKVVSKVRRLKRGITENDSREKVQSALQQQIEVMQLTLRLYVEKISELDEAENPENKRDQFVPLCEHFKEFLRTYKNEIALLMQDFQSENRVVTSIVQLQ